MLVGWIVSVIVLILSDERSFARSWVNAKLKLLGLLFSILSFIMSILPQRYDLQTSSTTVGFYNQTVAIGNIYTTTTQIDVIRFIVSFFLVILCAADLLISLLEDA